MATYRLEYRPSFDRDYAALPKSVKARVWAKVQTLADNSRPRGCKKLKSEPNLWRIRVGSYRVLYHVHDDVLLVILVRVGDRKDVYD